MTCPRCKRIIDQFSPCPFCASEVKEQPLQVAVFSTTSDDPMENYSYLVEEPNGP